MVVSVGLDERVWACLEVEGFLDHVILYVI